MDTPEKPKRHWWRKKRTWAAGVTLLIVAYPAAMGPLGYAWGRQWASDATFDTLSFTARTTPSGDDLWPVALYRRYVRWCGFRGGRVTIIERMKEKLANESRPARRRVLQDSLDQFRKQPPEPF